MTGPLQSALSGAKRALSFLPHLPIYVWVAAAAGVAVLLGSRSTGAATPLPAHPAGAPPLVQLGSTGPWVTYLQGLLGVPQTGTFDAPTDKAVRDYQSANGLTVDGIVGGGTWGALGVTGSAPPAGNPGGGGNPPPPKPPPVEPPSGNPSPPTTGNPFGLADTIDAREAQILGYVSDGAVEHQWWPLDYTWTDPKTNEQHQIHIEVSRRALALSNGPNTRLTVNASMRTAQKIADMIGGAIMTTRIADEIAAHASKVVLNSAGVPPSQHWQGPGTDESGSKTFRMYDQSNFLEGKVAGAQGLVSNEGKDWVMTRRYWTTNNGGINPNNTPPGTTGSPHNHANFGWYPGTLKSPAGVPVIQSIGLAHGPGFTDYSQLLRFVRPASLTIDGISWDWGAALADPTVSKYLQDEGGTIPSPRHPDL